MTKLGRCVDKLQVDLLQGPLLGVGQERLAKSQNSLLGSNAATLREYEVKTVEKRILKN